MENLQFRRQFAFLPKTTKNLPGWSHLIVGTHHLYTHKDLARYDYVKGDTHVILLGHILDPKDSKRTEHDILSTVSDQPDEIAISEALFGLVGRFVLIVSHKDHLTFFNDACGLKSFFYTIKDNQLYLASQPTLLRKIDSEIAVPDKRYNSYFSAPYTQRSKEHWFPSGISLYREILHLAPNHYLTTKNFRQIRYWPSGNHDFQDYDTVLEKFTALLQSTIRTASQKYKLAHGITGGYDSRMILSACKEVQNDLSFFTLQYRNLTKESSDIWIPTRLKNRLNIDHQVIDCRGNGHEAFNNIYLQNSDMAHLNDWGHIAYGIRENLSEDTMIMKGNCSETGRCYFYKSGIHPNLRAGKDLLKYNLGWKGIPFIEKRLSEWYTGLNDPNVNKGYKLLDLFHWEISTGSLQTQNQLEWDIVNDTFTPFNNRELLDCMLRIPTKYRSLPTNYQLYRDAMKILWPETLSEPINPQTSEERFKSSVKKVLFNIGFERYNH